MTSHPDRTAFPAAEYYLRFSHLFETLSRGSGFTNLGFTEPGRRPDSPDMAQQRLVRRVAEAAGLEPGHSVLDAGCGLGGPAEWMAGEFRVSVVGADPGRHAAQAWRDRPAAAKRLFVRGDAQRLPFRKGSFDRVVSIESAFHYPDKPLFLRSASEALKPGGRLVVADILQRPGSRFSRGLAGPFAAALSAPEFRDPESYRRDADSAGLRLSRFEDLSEGVRRSLPLWAASLSGQWAVLRGRYSAATLIRIWAALAAAPLLLKRGPFTYGLMVFDRSGKD